MYYSWDRSEEISWADLPESFVLKCNHGCGYNIICKDKSRLNTVEATTQLNQWIHEDFSLLSAEHHYKHIPRKIICEKYLGDGLIDWKFFCFNGEPRFLYVSQGSTHDELKISFLNMDGTEAGFKRLDYPTLETRIDLPDNFDEMIDISRKLSSEFPFARIDLYDVDGQIYFSEITLTPSGGFMPFEPEQTDYELGRLINL